MKNILFIEDDKDLFEGYKEYFKAKGYKLHNITRGEGAVEYAGDLQPDAIVLDMILPGVGGAEVCRKLRKCEKTSNIPIILFTAVRTAMGIGISKNDYKWIPADAVIDKYKGFECLYKAVCKCLKGKRGKK